MGFVDNVATSLVCLCLLLQYVCGAKHVDLTGFSAYDFSYWDSTSIKINWVAVSSFYFYDGFCGFEIWFLGKSLFVY